MTGARNGMAALALLLAAAQARAQGYQTSFDDLNGWLAGSGTTAAIGWWNDGTSAGAPGGAARTGPNSLNYNNGADYSDPTGISNAGVAYSPVVSLAGLANPTLSFWCNFQTQPGSEDGAIMRDQRQVAIIPGNMYPLINEALGVTNGGPTLGPCSAMGTWHRHVVPLNPAWAIVQVGFVFNTVDPYDNGYAGWFIDDFALSEPPAGGGGGGGGGGTGGGGGGPAPASSGSEGDEGLCGLTGLESLLLLALLSLKRR